MHEGSTINRTRNQMLSETKRILKNYNLQPFKSYSQNFVIEPKLIEWHIQYANLTKKDVVVEIGAGLGTLTKGLAEKVKKVIAIEIDPKFIEILHKELASYGNIDIIEGDILKLDQKIFDNRKIVSNPPYKISSPLTFKIIQSAFILSVMSYQKEFAERMSAPSGSKNFGRITLGVNYYAKVEHLKLVPKDYFYPAPKVESALIRLTPAEPPFYLADKEDFFGFVRHLFSFRKKTLKRALTLYFKHSNILEEYRDKIKSYPLAEERIFRLSLQQFHELYKFVKAIQED